MNGRLACRSQVQLIVLGCVSYVKDADGYLEVFTGEWMVSVYRQLAVVDSGNEKRFNLAGLVLHLNFGTETAELRGNILQVIGKSQIRVMIPEPLFRRHVQLHRVSRLFSPHGRIHAIGDPPRKSQ